MKLITWDPFRGMDTFERRMRNIFGDVLDRPTREALLRVTQERGTMLWAPTVDIIEHEGEIEVKAELPEMDEKDIEIKIEDNVLTLSGEKKLEHEDKKENYHLIESSYGKFTRAFTLPGHVDQEKIKAKYEKGVLKITMPKKEETKPKQIKVKAA